MTDPDAVAMVDAAIKDGKDNDEIDRLVKLGKVQYLRERTAAAEKLGIEVKDLDALVKEYIKAEKAEVRRQNKKQKADEEAPPKTDSELEESARDIIACENVLAKFVEELGKVISGEERNAKIIYLNATTRVLDKCNHTAIKGPSSCGKSELRTRVLEFMPPESVISFTALSEKALIFEKRSFEHKILSMGEAITTEETALQDYFLRELMSEGKLRYHVVQKVDGELVTIIIEKNGPVAFTVTTTRDYLHQENETRVVSLEADDSPDQTAKVLVKTAELHGLNGGRNPIDLGPWQDFQRLVERGNCRVVIPYAVALAKLIPPSAVRLRRDFTQLLLAIKAHAIIHSSHRKVSAAGEIIADVEHDYTIVRDLMKDVLAESSGKSVRETVQGTVTAVEKATADMATAEGATAQQVGKLLNLDKSAARRRLHAAINDGFVLNLELRRGQPGKYRCSGQALESEQTLPHPSEILATMPPDHLTHCSISVESVADPLATVDATALPPPATALPPPAYNTADDPVAYPVAYPVAQGVATVNSLNDKDKPPPVARWQRFPGGEAPAVQNGAPTVEDAVTGTATTAGSQAHAVLAQRPRSRANAPPPQCVHCGGIGVVSEEGEGGEDELAPYAMTSGRRILLHPRCQAPWAEAMARTKSKAFGRDAGGASQANRSSPGGK